MNAAKRTMRCNKLNELKVKMYKNDFFQNII